MNLPAPCCVVFGALILGGCHGPEIATLELGDIGQSVDEKIAVTAGQQLEFAFVAGPYEYDGNDAVILDIALLKDERSVRQASWTVLLMGGGFGNRVKATRKYKSEWKLTVPPEGTTAIRASTRLEHGTSKVKFGAIELIVHAK